MADSQGMEMGKVTEMPLILGGHSFISQLGNDPSVSERDQCGIVESCLDHSIRWFDTTYQPERIALGNVLHSLGRRNEATIMAWNFFTDFSPQDQPTRPEYYRPNHIDLILEQLHTDHVDCLVAIPLDDPEENQRQVELLIEWQRKDYVRSKTLKPSNGFEMTIHFDSQSDRSTSQLMRLLPPSRPANWRDGKQSPLPHSDVDGNSTR